MSVTRHISNELIFGIIVALFMIVMFISGLYDKYVESKVPVEVQLYSACINSGTTETMSHETKLLYCQKLIDDRRQKTVTSQ